LVGILLCVEGHVFDFYHMHFVLFMLIVSLMGSKEKRLSKRH